MTGANGSEKTQQTPAKKTRSVTIGQKTVVLTPFRLVRSAAILLILLALIVVSVIHFRPRLGMWLSAGIWIVRDVYWTVAAKNSAPSKNAESQKSSRFHQILITIAFLLLFIPVPGLLRRFLPAAPLLVPIGLTLQSLSFLLAIWARRHLGRNWSAAVRISTEHQLVRSGPYRLLRHPIYTSMFGMFCGTALVCNQIRALVGIAILAFAYWRKIRMEENILRETFGAEYDAYKRHTWALVPGLI
ncbi:MAG: isoprenylcysteine carboxylmethyltransferase family protein [Candidatus Acidiferrales bacterium]